MKRVVTHVRVLPEFMRNNLTHSLKTEVKKKSWLFYLEKISDRPLRGHRSNGGGQDLTISKWQLFGFPHTCSKDPITHSGNAIKSFPTLQIKEFFLKIQNLYFLLGQFQLLSFCPILRSHTTNIWRLAFTKTAFTVSSPGLIHPISFSCLQRAYFPKL